MMVESWLVELIKADEGSGCTRDNKDGDKLHLAVSSLRNGGLG